MDVFVKLRLRVRHVLAAINALLFHGDRLHDQARSTDDKNVSEGLRGEAEEAFAARREIWSQFQMTNNQGKPGVVITDNTAPVQNNHQDVKFHVKGSRDLLVASVMGVALATALLTVVYLDVQLREAHDKLAAAYKDIQTQVWVKQDKEEEKFQKFVAGPYAQLAGELRANEILLGRQCPNTEEKRK